MELTQDICALLNKDWQFYPQAKFFSATVLAGSILFNRSNNQAITINTMEMYGRTKNIDSHRESFGKLKAGAQTTSLPPSIKTLYPDVWPTTLQRHDGQKLVIGTQVSNALVTSSIRLDTNPPLPLVPRPCSDTRSIKSTIIAAIATPAGI